MGTDAEASAELKYASNSNDCQASNNGPVERYVSTTGAFATEAGVMEVPVQSINATNENSDGDGSSVSATGGTERDLLTGLCNNWAAETGTLEVW